MCGKIYLRIKFLHREKVKLSIAEIISLFASIGAMLSVVVGVITCFISVRFKKPKISLVINQSPQSCYYLYFQKPSGEIVGTALMSVSICNSSAVPGTIANIEIIYKKRSYSVETINSNFNPEWFRISPTNSLKQDIDKFRLKVPLAVPAFSAFAGYFLLPEIFITNEKEISVTVRMVTVENKFKIKFYKQIRFEEHNKNASRYHEHHIDEIRNYSLFLNNSEYSFLNNSCTIYSFNINTNDYQ